MNDTANLHSTAGQLRVLANLDRAALVAAAAQDSAAVKLYRTTAMAAADALARHRAAHDAAIATGDPAAFAVHARRNASVDELVAWTPVVVTVHAAARALLDMVANAAAHPAPASPGDAKMRAMIAAYRESTPTHAAAGG